LNWDWEWNWIYCGFDLNEWGEIETFIDRYDYDIMTDNDKLEGLLDGAVFV